MTSVAEVQKQVQTFFTIRVRQLAKETFAIQRECKLNGSTLLQTLVFGWQQHPHSCLDQLASQAGFLHIRISDTAIDKHFTPETATFLLACLQELTQIVVQTDHPLMLPLLSASHRLSMRTAVPSACQMIWPASGKATEVAQRVAEPH